MLKSKYFQYLYGSETEINYNESLLNLECKKNT